VAITNAIQDTEFDAAFPKTDYWPDTCKIVTQKDSATRDDYGYPTGAQADVATAISCRVMPTIGRFNRLEGFLNVSAVDADFLALMPWRTDVNESHLFVVTASTNTEWVDAEFDILLVIDPDGTHSHLELALNRKETN